VLPNDCTVLALFLIGVAQAERRCRCSDRHSTQPRFARVQHTQQTRRVTNCHALHVSVSAVILTSRLTTLECCQPGPVTPSCQGTWSWANSLPGPQFVHHVSTPCRHWCARGAHPDPSSHSRVAAPEQRCFYVAVSVASHSSLFIILCIDASRYRIVKSQESRCMPAKRSAKRFPMTASACLSLLLKPGRYCLEHKDR
jgi:hypothetical protein